MAKVKFTVSRLADFRCPEGKSQAFLWDLDTPGLALRATKNGAKTFVFQRPFNGVEPRMKIGGLDAWKIPKAQARARELQQIIDSGRDPRQVKAESMAADAAKRTAEVEAELLVSHAWAVYLSEGKPRKKDAWKPRYRADLVKAAAPGGEPKKRGKGVTKPGHLAALMPMRLRDINEDVIRDWFAVEQKRAPVQAGRAVAIFSGFLGWCATRKEFRGVVDKRCARGSELGDVLPPSRRRTDALERDQLPAWFAGVAKLESPFARVYLIALLVTGARREEMAALKCGDVDYRWRKLVIADKIDATRIIPLAPYLAALLQGLPRVPGNDYVFVSPTSKTGRISEPRSAHDRVLADAGIPHVSIHGLRRSFALLGEAAGAPAGAIAQIMGHRPSAIAEGYKPRPIDDLRGYLTIIEKFILERAGVAFDPATAVPGSLRVIAGATRG